MSVKFSIKYMTGDLYLIQWEQSVAGRGVVSFASRMKYREFSLNKLLSEAKNRISGTYGNEARKANGNVFLGLYKNTSFEWDWDYSTFPEVYKKQAEAQLSKLQTVPLGFRAPVKEEPVRLFYIDTSAGLPQLRKLSNPLLTWSEACELLKEKVC